MQFRISKLIKRTKKTEHDKQANKKRLEIERLQQKTSETAEQTLELVRHLTKENAELKYRIDQLTGRGQNMQ